MSTRGRLRSAAVLTASSVVLGAAGGFAWVTGWPSWESPGDLVRAGLVLAGHLLFAAAGTLLLRALRPDSGRLPWLFLAGMLVALPSLQLFVVGYSAAFDAADAGVPAGPLARLAFPALLITGAGFGTAIAALLLSLDRRRRIWSAALIGLAGAAPAAYLFFLPLQAIWLPVGLGIGLTLGFARRPTSAPAPRPAPTPDPGAGRLVRPLAAAGVGIVVLVWAVGVWVGVATTGTETATTAMGLAAGGAQVAAVPVFLSAALLLRRSGRGGASTRPLALLVTTVGVLAGTTIALLGMSPDAGALYLGSLVSGGALGLWLASVTLAVFPGPVLRVVVALGTLVAAEVAWFLLVPLTGGVVLGAIGLALLLAGPRPARVSPAPAPASP